jgi:hypothetical protein
MTNANTASGAAPPDPQEPAAQTPGRRKGLRARLGHLRRAWGEARQAPVLSGLIAASVFVILILAEQLVTWVYDAYKPDVLADQAEILSAEVARTSDEIETRVTRISAMLEDMQAGGSVDQAALQAEMDRLVQGMDALKPDLARVARMGDTLARASLQAKQQELTATGLSRAADVVLGMRDGATLCPQRYTLAVEEYSGETASEPTVRLSSPTGSGDWDQTMEVGASLLIEDDLGRVTVSYMRHEVVGNDAYYSFNFNCPA